MAPNSKLFTGFGEIHGKFWYNIQRGAAERGHAFLITIEEAWNLFIKQNKVCALSGLPIVFASSIRGWENGECTASLDRIDSSRPYILDNVQWVHKDINLMKQGYDQKYFLKMCKLVFENSVAQTYDGTYRHINREINYKDIYLLPKKSIAESRSLCDTSVVFGSHKFSMPVYPANMKSVVNEETCKYLASKGWFYTMHRFGINNSKFIQTMHDSGYLASVSFGVRGRTVNEDLKKLVIMRPEFITIDVANAWSTCVESKIKYIKDMYPESFLIVGNVATPEAVVEIQEWGADAIKVGIAGGHVCTTKYKTGFHRPMATTVLECSNVSKVPIIADGGIEQHGDIAKAIACGATLVMAGSLFAGYDESSGNVIEIDSKRYKEYYGSASEFNKEEKKNIEGRKVMVDYKGPLQKLLTELKEDLQSSISYAGGTDLSVLHNSQIIEG